jgi:hypothetical protein
MRNIKLYEDYVDSDYEMQRIIKELEKRAKYWFENGPLSKDAQLVDIKQTETAISTKKSLIVEFNDNEFYYQIIIRINIDDIIKNDEPVKCEMIIKKYNSNSENGEALELNDQLSFTGEDKVEIDEIKGEFILDKIAELNSKSENPDENEIKVPKESEPEEETPPTQEETPPPQGETPPPQGEIPPPAQGGQGTPPPAQGTPPAL